MSARAHQRSGYSPLQTHFPFIPTDAVEALTELWQSEWQRRETRAQKGLVATRKRSEYRVIGDHAWNADWQEHKDLLDLPLFLYEPSDLDTQPAEGEDVGQEAASHAVAASDEVQWTDADVEKLHVGLLHYSLRLLKARGNAEEKYEILRWIWAPDVFCWVIRSSEGVHQRIPIYRRQLPFMFDTCCAFDGLRPDVMRQSLAAVLRPWLREMGMESLIN